MQKLWKLNLLITIVLLNCFTNSYANDTIHSSKGEEVNVVEIDDSVLISYSDLRIVNSKLIELEYEKELNKKLKTIISNDSITISSYERINEQLNSDYKKTMHQRNMSISIGTIVVICTIVLSLLK